ncbi:kinase-like protein [Trametes punicea]|nr:kinase-like protein [Trametes punicea]
MSRQIKRVTLTSKKNWWMVELDEEEDGAAPPPLSSAPSEEGRTAESQHHRTPRILHRQTPRTQREHDFLLPHTHFVLCAPNPTQHLAPFAAGSASEVFKCVVKKPNVVQLEINGEMQSNAKDVTTQFLAELRVYTTLARHRNITAFLGCLENVGMVLEHLEGRTLYDVIREQKQTLSRAKKVDYHNQLLDGLTHLHSYGLSHGDLSLLNIFVTYSSDTIKLFDFGRSVSADSIYASPDDDLSEPPASPPLPASRLNSRFGATPKPPPVPLPPAAAPRKVEHIYPGTRPFSAPEILRGECQDARLADAYSFGMILVCLDRCDLVDVKPWEQRKDKLPDGFLDDLPVFGDRCREYLKRWDQGRRRLVKSDMMDVDVSMMF